MPGKAGSLEVLAQHVGLALKPLQTHLSADNIIPFLAQLGLQFPPQLLQPGFVAALNTVSGATGLLVTSLDQLTADIENDNEAGIAQHGLQLIQQIQQVIAALPQIGIQLGSIAGTLPGMNVAEVTAFANKLPSNLLSHLLISHLENVQPGIVGIANLLGVLSYVPTPDVPGDPTHPAHVRRQLQLSNLSAALKSPTALLQSLYHWGQPDFDGTLLIPALNSSLNLFGLYTHPSTPELPNGLSSGLFTVETTTAPPGLAATLNYDLPAGFQLTLPLSALWSVNMQVKGAFQAGLTAAIVFPANITMKPPAGSLDGLLQMDLVAKPPDKSHPIIIVGETSGSRLQTDSISLGIGLSVKSNVAEPVMRFEVAGGKIVIDTGKADGFITKILGGAKLESTFDLAGDYSLTNGLHFQGSSALEVQLASHFSLGPLAVNALTLSVGIKDDAFPIGIRADLQTSLGPLDAVVQGIGFKIDVVLTADNKGNLGPVDLKPGFLAPKGIGLSLDAGGFKGGGFLMLDSEKGEYAGALELDFNGLFSVKAIGIINTKMPDGSKGFSLLIVIAAEFTPIQLSFGFTLNGVGGIFGLNRMIVVAALAEGIRTNADQEHPVSRKTSSPILRASSATSSNSSRRSRTTSSSGRWPNSVGERHRSSPWSWACCSICLIRCLQSSVC